MYYGCPCNACINLSPSEPKFCDIETYSLKTEYFQSYFHCTNNFRIYANWKAIVLNCQNFVLFKTVSFSEGYKWESITSTIQSKEKMKLTILVLYRSEQRLYNQSILYIIFPLCRSAYGLSCIPKILLNNNQNRLPLFLNNMIYIFYK